MGAVDPRTSPTALDPATDVAVIGAGAVGLALALALAQAGLSVALVGPAPRGQTGRTVALLDGSVRLLEALGVWPRLRAHAAPLKRLRIVDATPSLFRGPPVTFQAKALGLPAFGYNIENDTLVSALEDEAGRTPGLVRRIATVMGYSAETSAVTAQCVEGAALRSRLLVGADGARSVIREHAGITVRQHAYPQVALTALLHHTIPHRETSTEFHTREGPFTLVPLPGTAQAPHRSSMVWVMSPAQADNRLATDHATVARAIEQQSRALLGSITVPNGIGRFPIRRVMADRLIGSRVALVGEAAHALPPIGAQGLNLSFRDAAALVDIIVDARGRAADIGATAVLQCYERARLGDIAVRGSAVDALNRALLTARWPVDAIRGFGLGALAAVRPLRDAVMRQGLQPQHAVPRLMRTPLPEA